MSEWKHGSFGARLRHAARGLAHALGREQNLKIQAVLFLVALGALLYYRPGPGWWALVLLASAGVFACELLNTAIEQLADALHPHHHPAIGIAKDCAAAAVLLAALGALAVGAALLVHLAQAGRL